MSQPRFFVAAGLCLALAGCASPRLPSVTDEDTGLDLTGKVIWHDLLTSDPEASRHFYGELFGWQFEDVSLRVGTFSWINYTLIRHSERLIGGMVDTTRLDRDQSVDISQWVVVLSVNAVDQAVQTLRDAGGTVFTPPTDVADRGRIAVVADPQGALLALLQTREGDPHDVEATIGEFLWNELWASDVDAATQFYQQLAPYAVEKRENGEQAGYRVLSTAGTPRVGVRTIPVDDLAPVWVTYIRVANPGAITARVEALGGQVLLEPQSRPMGGEVALILGPSGEGIALQTWERAGN